MARCDEPVVAVERGRLLHVVGDSAFGGASKIISDLVVAASDDGWDVAVLATDYRFVGHLTARSVRVVEMDVIRRSVRPLRDVVGLLRLLSYLRKERYDIIHTHTSKGGFVGRAGARLARIPVVIHTAHGLAIHEGSSRVATYLYSSLERLAGRWSDVVVLVSAFHREWAQRLRLGPPERLVCIVNGVNSETVKAATPPHVVRVALGVPPGGVLVVSTSRMARGKGIEDVIGAVARLDSVVRRTMHVVFAGDGPDLAKYRRRVERLGLTQEIRFLGFRNDVADLLGAADVVVLPSLREGMSVALLEAMAAGAAIIGTSIGSIREALEGVGLIVAPGAPAELADALTSLARNPAYCAGLGEAARARQRSCYQAQDMVESYLSLYRQLSSRTRNRKDRQGAT